MKNQIHFKLLVLMVFLLSTTAIIAQSTVSGSVKDQNGDPIPGANVLLKGVSLGADSDFDGNFEIRNVANGTYTLVASFVGFDNFTKEITVNSSNLNIDVVIKENAQSLDEVIVTGVVNPKSKLESSVSISTINAKVIAQSSPRTTSEIFRNIPGVRAESSAGEGNSNFNVRGVPVSSGGSRYLQLQEDGLPLNLFGDTSFGNSDNWLRADRNVARVEAIRGGSASTQTSNGPAGIINLISKTGKTEGGSVSTTVGLDFNTNRVDFEYGTPLENGLSYHVGGFLRTGEGPRATGFNANKGGQIKANLTKRFKSGFIRTYVKFLNDKTAMYMPMPMLLQGTDDNPTYANLPGFDITTDALQSKYLQESSGPTSSDRNRQSRDVRDGNNVISKSIGVEFSFDLGEGWKVRNNGRIAINNGAFIAPFSAGFGETNAFVAGLPIPQPATLTYADNGDAYAPANGLIQNIHVFDTTIDDLSNVMNDIKVSKKLGDKVAVTAGYFTATQNTKISWQWNSFLQEVKGGGDARLVNVEGLSRGGQYAYGTPVWGNCCQRKYNTQHSVNAPYVGLDADLTPKLNFDGSIRFENVKVDGTIATTNQVGEFDVNNNNTIEAIEMAVPIVQPNQNQIVSDEYSFTSYSAGLNYKIDEGSAVFGRYSKGASGRAADRNGYNTDGTADVQYDEVSQFEVGYKKRFEKGTLNVTGFSSVTDEAAGFELQNTVGSKYTATGLEVESAFRFGDFSINGSATYTNAKIKEDRGGNGANDGNKPRRQADLVYNLAPTYSFGVEKQHLLALTVLGTTESYATDANDLVQPGYAYINLLGRVGLTKGLSLSLNINNLFDTVGITEVEGQDGIAINGTDRYVRARSITGRSSALTLQYTF
ncbi:MULTISPECIES: TonB-dependent receptor [Tenacibaculum]|uniref:TonB-dependent receptor n=1 Tax=Tenacibaculum TaxID=104267 RepID=UPI001F0B451A|nr:MULTISPECIES: TonB-dependent receptor [Tenacibaculum]MCH3882021.1 TonB-dependent receptor [Tenacibaculum aquimarinum]MDO6599662.1 TonB-dependent receptor [Tenacibaculum sp. 1_MG-2023]